MFNLNFCNYMKNKILLSAIALLFSIATQAQEFTPKMNLQITVGENNAIGNNYFDGEDSNYNELYIDHCLPALAISALYEPIRFIQIGCDVVVNAASCNKFLYVDNRTTKESVTSFLFGAMTSVRAVYVNTDKFAIYSGLSGGFCRYSYRNNIKVIGHITTCGIRYGSKLYGTVEIGVGYKGICSAGVGYRF